MKNEQQVKHEYQKFIKNNEEVLKLLAQKIRTLDTLKGVQDIKELNGRKHAIRIISEWLNELWGISTEELPKPEEKDELFRIIV